MKISEIEIFRERERESRMSVDYATFIKGTSTTEFIIAVEQQLTRIKNSVAGWSVTVAVQYDIHRK